MKTHYSAPEWQFIPICAETCLCQSPVNGGNEGIGFEDWGTGTTSIKPGL